MARKSLRFFLIILSVFVVNLLLAGSLDAGSRPRLSIGAIGISRRVVEFPLTRDSWAIRPWEKNVGHLAGTAWFDQPGNIVLAGHSEMPNGAPGTFYYLNQLGIGSDITLFDGSVNRHYSVVDIRTVSEYDMSVTVPTPDDRLTLITCDIGSYDAATQTYASRLIVIAQRVS
jgi:LPXTG-site transpeptidase (sortase) family protein